MTNESLSDPFSSLFPFASSSQSFVFVSISFSLEIHSMHMCECVSVCARALIYEYVIRWEYYAGYLLSLPLLYCSQCTMHSIES